MADTARGVSRSTLDNPARPHLLKAKTVHARLSRATESDLRIALREIELALQVFQDYDISSLPEGCRLVYQTCINVMADLAEELTLRSQDNQVRELPVRSRTEGRRLPRPEAVRFHPVRPVA